MRNQVLNIRSNTDYKIKSTYEEEDDDEQQSLEEKKDVDKNLT